MKEILGDYFRSLGQAAENRTAPVAWCSSVGPAELLRALGYEVYFPENHAAMLGASRQANRTMPRAHAMGYSQDICSYLTSDVGAYLSGVTPLAGYGLEKIPRADVLVFHTNQCRDVRDWFEFYGREWSVPVIGVTSIRGIDTVNASHVDAVTAQIEALVPVLEKISGIRLDPARLAETVRLSRECTELWKACLETAAHRPSPLTFFDGTIHMAPAVLLRGTETACDYYRLLLEELRMRVREGIAAVPNERYRLYWEGMPIWGKLRELSDLMTSLSTAIVASTYCNSWIFEALDPSDPIRSMARASIEIFICRSDMPKEQMIQGMVDRYKADGVLFHESRTCPNNSNTRYGMPRRLREQTGIPSITIEGDQNDLRCYSPEQSRTSIEGFIEQLADA